MKLNEDLIKNRLLSAVFSDETPDYRVPAEPEPGDDVVIRLRTGRDSARRVMLLTIGQPAGLSMNFTGSDGEFDYYEARLVALKRQVAYSFIIETEYGTVLYDKLGAKFITREYSAREETAFRFTPGFHVPTWAKGALQYQIFPDRFNNGNSSNDVKTNEYYYTVGHAKHAEWGAPVTDTDIRYFYGGDLQGIADKLDYLQELGIEVIYLNPVFISPSSHKYDCQDYEHIDPHLAVIEDDTDHEMLSWEKHNGYAPRYIRRVTAKRNLDASDAYFATFCTEIHRRGMKIILDGVFNHCGSFNKWLDREGIYLGKQGFEKGAYQDTESPYRDYFKFNERSGRCVDYEGWWGYATLPKLNYENSPELREKILTIAEKWASPPFSIDGWRLDVAADLGHSEDYNHGFWKEFRQRIKKINPELIIIAEHYGDASNWLQGDEWDTVMNYDAFMEPVTWFLTGMEKHSDSFDGDKYLDGGLFMNTMLKNMARFQAPSLYSAMNELSNHDHSRFLTRTNMKTGRLDSAGAEAADGDLHPEKMYSAVMLQMTWPGAPTVYYGDEAGMTGWTDPDCRRCFPWGHEDRIMTALHKKLAAIRNNSLFREGSFKPLEAGHGIIAYARFNAEGAAAVAVNALEEDNEFNLRVFDCGGTEGCVYTLRLLTGPEGFEEDTGEYRVKDGCISFTLPAGSAALFIRK